MPDRIQVLGISGSLRRGSFNTALLRACQELAPEGMSIEVRDLAPIPLYNEDVRSEGFPASVESFRTAIREADGLLFASPEYNRSISGVLKNAIDWASRQPDMPLKGKAAALMGCSRGSLGTALGHYHLRQVLSVLNVHAVPGGEVLIGKSADKFDDGLKLVDESTRDFVRKHLERLRDLIRALAPA